ncbi:TonB-dependent receptor [Dyella solisilvae]|nr:TonB-dependent receptor [Dyella solisilvae]
MAHAQTDDTSWHIQLAGEVSVPNGWVQVRENAIQGTRLHFSDDLNVNDMQTIRLQVWKAFSDVSELHFGFATHQLLGNATTDVPVYFNGTTIAPGHMNTATNFQDSLAFDASYWHRLVEVGQGGGLYGSIGATYVMLNFRMRGTVAADSVGNELKEDFYVQEMPVPIFGLHLRYPLTDKWRLTADATWGRLPWVNSFRTEGGEVYTAQTNWEAVVGLDYRLSPHWKLAGYIFHRYYAQDESSHEDGNQISLATTGGGFGVTYQF